MVTFAEIDEELFKAVTAMTVSEAQRGFLASNTYSLAQCWLYREAGDVFPFAICADGRPVGFILMDVDLEERSFTVWRLMIDQAHQNRGYGSQALTLALQKARDSGRFDYAVIDCHPENRTAEHVYRKLGFRHTGEISNGEIVMQLDF